jgi:hypothetical protein
VIVFSTTEVFSLSFLFFSILVSNYIIKTVGIEKKRCEFFADPSVSQTCAPQPLEPTSLHLYLWGFLHENVHNKLQTS